MKRMFFSIVLIIIGFDYCCHSQTVDWAVSFGGNYDDKVNAFAVDINENVYVTGSFIGTANFGSLSLTSTNPQYSDFFVAKYNNKGEIQWVIKGEGLLDENGYDITTDLSGNVYVRVISGSDSLSIENKKIKNLGGFLLKFNSNGNLIWGRGDQSYWWGDIYNIPRMCVDKFGNIVLLNNLGFHEGILRKFNTDGEILWENIFKDKSNSGGRINSDGLTIDSDGNIYFIMNFDIGLLVDTSYFFGKNSLIFCKYSPDGKFISAKQIGGIGDGFINGTSMTIDAYDNVYFGGSISDKVNFGDTTISSTDNYHFLAKFNSSLQNLWAMNIYSGEQDPPQYLSVNPDGDIYIQKRHRFFKISNFKEMNILTNMEWLCGVQSSQCGNIFFTGFYSGSMDLYPFNLQSAGKFDSYVGKLKRAYPLPLSKPSLSFPATNTSGHNLISQLGWFGVGCASSYQIQISKDENFNQIVFDKNNISNYSIYCDSLDYLTQYFWKVRAFSSDTLSEWSETWSFTTVKPEPDEVSLVYPANNSNNIEKQLTLTWDLTPRATKYFLQIAKDEEFGDKVVSNANIVENNFQVDLEFETQYYWKVAAANSFGASEWSDVWSFKIRPDKPARVSLIIPEDKSVDVAVNPFLRWSDMGTDYYHLQIAQDIDFIFKDISIDVWGLSWRDTLEKNTEYYWRVRGVNSFETGDWSDVWSFKTGTTVGVAENSHDNQFDIRYEFGSITIMYNDILESSKAKYYVNIYDYLGKSVLKENIEINESYNSINIDELQSGLYLIHLKSATGKVEIHKFIKK